MIEKAILGLATIIALSGCSDGYQKESSATEISDHVTVKLPEDCRQIVDIKFYPSGGAGFDEILCKDGDGGLVLYVKDVQYAQKWTARHYLR